VYVDDLLITAENESAINSLLEQLVKHFKRVETEAVPTTTSEWDYCSTANRGRWRSPWPDTSSPWSATTTSAADLLKLSDPNETLLSPDLQKSLHSTVARIQYLASRTRPDIQFVTSHLASKVNKFVASDQGKVTKLLEYLAGTADNGITLHIPNTSTITMSLYADASFAIHDLSRSHSGGSLSLGSGSIAWKSKKQSLTTTSTAESELVALSDMSSLLFHMEKSLIGQGCTVAKKIMYQDNATTIHMLTTEKHSTMRNAHIGSKYFFLGDYIASGDIQVLHLRSQLMIADQLTKSVNGNFFNSLRAGLLGEWSLPLSLPHPPLSPRLRTQN
jgi:hypothetical protein